MKNKNTWNPSENLHERLFAPRALRHAVRDFKTLYITEVLEKSNGVQKVAAEILQVQPTYLSKLLKSLRTWRNQGI